eukprot:507684_1
MGNDCFSKGMDAIGSAGSGVGDSLLSKGKETGNKILSKVDDKLTESVDKIIDDKLANKLESTFDKTVELMIDKTLDKATSIFDENVDKLKGRLVNCELSKKLIKKMEKEGLLDASIWNEDNDEITKGRLKHVGMNESDIEKWINAKEKYISDKKEKKKEEERKRKQQLEKMSSTEKGKLILKEWNIPNHLIMAMDHNGWLDYNNWNLIYIHHLKEMGFKSGHVQIFIEKFKPYKENHDSLENLVQKYIFDKMFPPNEENKKDDENFENENDDDILPEIQDKMNRTFFKRKSKRKGFHPIPQDSQDFSTDIYDNKLPPIHENTQNKHINYNDIKEEEKEEEEKNKQDEQDKQDEIDINPE